MSARSRMPRRRELGALAGFIERIGRPIEPIRGNRRQTTRLDAGVERQPPSLKLRTQPSACHPRARRIHGKNHPSHTARIIELALGAEAAVIAPIDVLGRRILPQFSTNRHRFLRRLVGNRQYFLQADELTRVRRFNVGMTQFVERTLE